jgi:uncharacterized membrane protein YhaH (DUF805 family)
MQWYLKVLSNYATFAGRARRKEYWLFFLFNFIIVFSIGFIGALIQAPDFIVNLYRLVVFIPSIAVGVRRMHDTNHNGWWLLLPIWNIVLLCTSGENKENRYGPNPKTPGPNSTPQKVVHQDNGVTSIASYKQHMSDNISQLERLADLKAKGHLTEEEFAMKKKQLLAS